MFAELWNLINRQAQSIMNRQSSSERRILAELAIQRQLLNQILAAVTLPPAASASLVFEVEGQKIEGEHIKMKIPQGKKGTLTVVLKNAAGGPGRVDGVPTWKASADGVVALTPAADGLSCGVETLPVPADQPAQSAIITFDADGDLGDGVIDIVATFTATVYDPASGAVIAEIATSDFA